MQKEVVKADKKKRNAYETKNLSEIVTSLDAARIAGVSQTSVPRVFNPQSSRVVGQEMKDKLTKVQASLAIDQIL